MGFRLALLVLFFLAGGLFLRGLMARGRKARLTAGHVVLGHLLALFFGILISPNAFGLIDKSVQTGLEPILDMAFGWIGFLFGFQFNYSMVGRLPKDYFARALGEGAVTFLFVAIPAFFFLGAFKELWGGIGGDVTKTALAMAAALSISSPTLLGAVFTGKSASNPLARLLTVAASSDGLIGVGAMGLINVFWHPAGMSFFMALVMIVILSVGQAVLIRLLLKNERKAIPTVILGIGVLTFGAGLSAYLGILPVVPGVLAGVIAANMAPGLRQRLARMLLTAESGLYLGLIILTGVFLPLTSDLSGMKWALTLFIFVAIVLRLAGKFTGGMMIGRGAGGKVSGSQRRLFAMSLQSTGALTLVAALCYERAMGGPMAPYVVVASMGVFIAGELAAAWSAPRLLKTMKS